MDRRTRTMLAGCGFSLVLAVTGCRSPNPEVPPGHKYMNDGRQVPPNSFSSQDPRPPVGGMAAPSSSMGGMNGPSSMGGLYGGPPGASNNFGAPSDHAYGGPGTAGTTPLVNPPAGSPASLGAPAGGAAEAMPSMGDPSQPGVGSGIGTTPANGFPPPQ
jgi:hypothetical protein